jgi:hypothetical protein
MPRYFDAPLSAASLILLDLSRLDYDPTSTAPMNWLGRSKPVWR